MSWRAKSHCMYSFPFKKKYQNCIKNFRNSPFLHHLCKKICTQAKVNGNREKVRNSNQRLQHSALIFHPWGFVFWQRLTGSAMLCAYLLQRYKKHLLTCIFICLHTHIPAYCTICVCMCTPLLCSNLCFPFCLHFSCTAPAYHFTQCSIIIPVRHYNRQPYNLNNLNTPWCLYTCIHMYVCVCVALFGCVHRHLCSQWIACEAPAPAPVPVPVTESQPTADSRQQCAN